MQKVEIYTQPQCPFCSHAKALLDSREITYEEYNVATDQGVLSEMLSRTGGRTLPQIVINNQAIGGFEDLRQLDSEGRLSSLLDAGSSVQ
ncbi:MAG: glutaredoxin 3 [Candidatus Thiodiazotropha sp. (ex Notomyrtea botanica)]|nr:glutaredoxin 3 [Candidatus Thiodiazotropha sp. (ex Notomyrtea botanica)]